MGMHLMSGKFEQSMSHRRGPKANHSQHAMVIKEDPFPIVMSDGQDEAQKSKPATCLSSGYLTASRHNAQLGHMR